MTRYTVTATVSTNHRFDIDIPDEILAAGGPTAAESAAMDAIRRLPPEQARRTEAIGTTVVVTGAARTELPDEQGAR